jgi:hypothetical protein
MICLHMFLPISPFDGVCFKLNGLAGDFGAGV